MTTRKEEFKMRETFLHCNSSHCTGENYSHCNYMPIHVQSNRCDTTPVHPIWLHNGSSMVPYWHVFDTLVSAGASNSTASIWHRRFKTLQIKGITVATQLRLIVGPFRWKYAKTSCKGSWESPERANNTAEKPQVILKLPCITYQWLQ